MSLKQAVYSQFKQPRGNWGSLVGFIMARRSANIKRNLWTLELLDLKATDSVLEIGYGPGVAIQQVALRVPEGMVVGIDHSQIMLEQACKRNASTIENGLVKLYCGEVFDLPNVEQAFDKIYSANVMQFWDDPLKVFARLYELLAYGGTIATTYMPNYTGATNMDAVEKGKEIAAYLHATGFSQIEMKSKTLKPVMAVCVLAKKE